jgi:hypothetical protein
MSYLWYYLGYAEITEPEVEYQPNLNTLRKRDELMKQIRNSSLKLRPVFIIKKIKQYEPIKYKK